MTDTPRAHAASSATPEGVSSLRYQALNKDSYRLDSPPFTGAAVTGAGPVTQGLDQPLPTSVRAAGSASQVPPAASSHSTVVPVHGRYDRDVPTWALDRHTSEPGELDDELDEHKDTTKAPTEEEDASIKSPFTAPVPRQGESMVRWMANTGHLHLPPASFPHKDARRAQNPPGGRGLWQFLPPHLSALVRSEADPGACLKWPRIR